MCNAFLCLSLSPFVFLCLEAIPNFFLCRVTLSSQRVVTWLSDVLIVNVMSKDKLMAPKR